jgi:hypothetical protein
MEIKKTPTLLTRWLSSMKKNPEVLPVFFFAMVCGPSLMFYMIYHKLQGPEIISRSDPEPWNKFEKKQIKLYSEIDHENYEHPRPRF